MTIVSVEPPARSAGRRRNLSEEELATLAKSLKSAKPGEFFGDNQNTHADGTPLSRSCAYQRAKSAIKALGITNVRSTAWPADPSLPEEERAYYWGIGPRAEGERPRGRRPKATQSS